MKKAFKNAKIYKLILVLAAVAELVYALVLGTSARNGLRVRVSPAAPENIKQSYRRLFFSYHKTLDKRIVLWYNIARSSKDGGF